MYRSILTMHHFTKNIFKLFIQFIHLPLRSVQYQTVTSDIIVASEARLVITLYIPREAANQAEIVRDSRVGAGQDEGAHCP